MRFVVVKAFDAQEKGRPPGSVETIAKEGDFS